MIKNEEKSRSKIRDWRRLHLTINYLAICLFFWLIWSIQRPNIQAQHLSNPAQIAFDYCQMKRNVANQLVSKNPPVREEIDWAINLQKELMGYLDKPEIRAYAEIDQSLKSQRADVRFDLVRALLIAGRKDEAIKTLHEMVDEAGSGFYSELMKAPPFTQIAEEPEFQKVLSRLLTINQLSEGQALKTPFQPNISEEEKIAGLSLFWSNVRLNFVYFDQIPQIDWDKTYLEYLPKVRQTKTTYEYYKVLQEMCALLKDGHTNVYLPNILRNEMELRPPFRTILIEDKVIVWKVMSESLKKQGFQPGIEILKIDGIPVKEYAEKFVTPFQSYSTPQDLAVRTYTFSLLAGPKEKSTEFELKNAKGEHFKRLVSRTGYTDVPAPTVNPLEFKVLAGNIGYLAINTFDTDKVVKDFIQNFEAVAKTDALVIDLRENGGGNSNFGEQILSYLTDEPFLNSRSASREHRALRKVSGVQIEWIGENPDVIQPNKEKFYSRPIVVLTSPRTYSAAEDFLVAFDYMKRGKIIGEATGGSTGQPLSFSLPGGGSARICSKRDTYPDGKKFVGIGIQPHIRVSLKISDFVEGRDSVLETALKKIKEKE